MSITESDQRVMRELFMEAAADLLGKERELLTATLAPTNARLSAIEARLSALEGQVSGLVRIEAIERRLAVLEEAGRH